MPKPKDSVPHLCAEEPLSMTRTRHHKRNRAYHAILLAIYWLSDSEGLFCDATNREVARAAGCHPDTVKNYLHALERDGVIAIFGPRHGYSCRMIVLLDGPEADTWVRMLRPGPRQPSGRV